MRTDYSMMRAGLAVLCVTIFGLTGCTAPSLEPLYSAQDQVFDQNLLGVWNRTDKDDGAEKLIVMHGDGAEYSVLRMTDSIEGFTVRLVELGSVRFADVAPVLLNESSKSVASSLFVQGHGLARVTVHGDTLTVALLDIDWIKQNEGTAAAPLVLNTRSSPGYLITASTAQLREFAAANASTRAFGQTREWQRDR
jgi:hypothetical protein